MNPKLSIIWLNYNSKNYLNIALKSIESILHIDLPIELIVVDNGSIDGSFERIHDYLINNLTSNVKLKTVRLEHNLGFTGGNNVGFKYVSPYTNYVMLMNNDLILEDRAVKRMVNWIESRESVGMVQGIIYKINSSEIDNSGFLCTELLNCIPLQKEIEKPTPITYASGALLVVKKTVIEKIGKLFDWEGLMYFDDMPLGFRAWMHGFKVLSLPIISGWHLGGASGGLSTPRTVYYIYRGYGIMIEISNSRLKHVAKYLAWKNFPVVRSLRDPKLLIWAIKGLREGLKIGALKRAKEGEIDIYKAPLIKLEPLMKVLEILLPHKIFEEVIKRRISTGGRCST
jgi:GT2 family glycosyltransferase